MEIKLVLPSELRGTYWLQSYKIAKAKRHLGERTVLILLGGNVYGKFRQYSDKQGWS